MIVMLLKDPEAKDVKTTVHPEIGSANVDAETEKIVIVNALVKGIVNARDPVLEEGGEIVLLRRPARKAPVSTLPT